MTDGGRRHRLDQAGRERAAARHQSRGGILRRGAGHQRQDQSQRHGDARPQHHLHQRGAHARRRRLVGRHDRRAAGRVPGLARPAVDAGDRPRNRRQGRASQRALHRARGAVPLDRSRVGRSRGRAHQRVHLRRTPLDHHAAGLPGLQLERRRLRRRHHGLGDHGRGHRRGRRRAPRSHGHAAFLRLPHGRLLPSLAQDAAHSELDAAHLPRQLVPQETTTANSCGRASARTCAC